MNFTNINTPHIIYGGVWDSNVKYVQNTITKTRIASIYELELFIEDGGKRYINGYWHNIKQGDVFLALPGDTCVSKTRYKCLFLRFDMNDEYFNQIIEEIPRYNPSADDGNIKVNLEKIIKNSYCSDDMSLLENTILLLKIIYTLKKKTQVYVDINNHNLVNAYDYINKNYTKKISVEDVAKHCHISISSMYKTFNKHAGISPNEYINNKRLDFAKQLLTDTQLSVTQISQECGMSTQAYFCYLFKKKCGVTPKQFRKENKRL